MGLRMRISVAFWLKLFSLLTMASGASMYVELSDCELKAMRLRMAVVSAVAWKEFGCLRGLLSQLASLPITVRLLKTTGVGHLAADSQNSALSS